MWFNFANKLRSILIWISFSADLIRFYLSKECTRSTGTNSAINKKFPETSNYREPSLGYLFFPASAAVSIPHDKRFRGKKQPIPENCLPWRYKITPLILLFALGANPPVLACRAMRDKVLKLLHDKGGTLPASAPFPGCECIIVRVHRKLPTLGVCIVSLFLVKCKSCRTEPNTPGYGYLGCSKTGVGWIWIAPHWQFPLSFDVFVRTGTESAWILDIRLTSMRSNFP